VTVSAHYTRMHLTNRQLRSHGFLWRRRYAEARRQGVSVDALLVRFINEHAALTQPTQVKPELPVWHLGGAGTLHRRDIYDDVR
jgi:hypothetical protein